MYGYHMKRDERKEKILHFNLGLVRVRLESLDRIGIERFVKFLFLVVICIWYRFYANDAKYAMPLYSLVQS